MVYALVMKTDDDTEASALQAYLDEQPRGTKARLARETGLAYSTIHWLASGRTTAKPKTARLIADASGGQLTAAQILGVA